MNHRNNNKVNKFILSLIAMATIAIGVTIILNQFKKNLVFFYKPSELKSLPSNKLNQEIRLGGIVKKESLEKNQINVKFILEDEHEEVEVKYQGLLPMLFKEGDAAVAKGKLQNNNSFLATEILAKHDEYYIPKELEEKK